MARLLIPTDTSQATLGYLLADGTIPLTADWDVGAFDIKHEDNKGVVFGTGDDAKISYDGTSLIVDSAVVGSGQTVIAATGGLRIGTSGPSLTQSAGNLVVNNDLVLNQSPVTISDSGGVRIQMTSGGNMLLADDGPATRITVASSSPEVAVTGDFDVSGVYGAISVNGSADEVQLLVQGHTTQGAAIFTVEEDDGTDIFAVFDAATSPEVDLTGSMLIDGAVTTAVQLTVQAAASQSANIFVVEISSGADKFFVDSDGDTLMRGHIAMGASGAINAGRVLNLVELSTQANLVGALINPVGTASSGAGINVTGLTGIATWQGTSTSTGGTIRGLDFVARHNSDRAVTTMIGCEASTQSQVSGSGAWATSIAFNADSISLSGDEPTTAIGFRIENQGDASETSCFGIQILAQTAAGTLTLPLLVEDTSGTGVLSTRIHNRIGVDTFFGATSTPLAVVHIDQTATDGAKPTLFLDQADVSEQCIQFSSSGSDIDINLFTVNVTGAPKLSWDESADDLIFSTGVQVESRDVNRYAYSVGRR